MTVMQCLWCDMSVRVDAIVCPECGTQVPVVDTLPAKPQAVRSKVARRGGRVVLAMIAVPLMLTVAYGAHITRQQAEIDASSSGMVSVDATTSQYTDPVRRAVWSDGVKAVRLVLRQPDFAGFQRSFINTAPGAVVSLCGVVPGTVGYSGELGQQRFISVFGQSEATAIEGSDASFQVLWDRVCTRGPASSSAA